MRKNRFTGRNSLPLLALVSICLPLQSQAQSAEPIGTVIFASGDVQARGADGSVRALARRAPVFEQDTIIVGASGVAHLRMVDSATISLRPDTEFTFDDYEFDGDAATPDSAVMELLRGGFRTISGSIGDGDQDEHKIDTPYASIGIRGTTHLARIVDDRLLTGVEEGATTVANDFGSLDTGFDGGYDFAETRAGAAPQGLRLEPLELNANTFFQADPVEVLEQQQPDQPNPNTVNAQATGGSSAEEAEESDEEDSSGNDDAPPPPNDSAPQSGAPQPGGNIDDSINPVLNARTLEQLVGAITVPDPDPQPEPGIDPKPDPGTNPKPDPKPDPGTDPKPDPGTDPKPDPGTDPKPDPGTDPKPDPGTNPKPDPGTDPKPDPGNDLAIYAVSTLGIQGKVLLGKADHAQTPLVGSVLDLLTKLSPEVEHPKSNFKVNWGRWASADVLLPANLPAGQARAQIYWATAPEATGLANLKGNYSYQGDNVCANGSCIGNDSSGGNLKKVDLGFAVNFGTGAITDGSLAVIDRGNRHWDVSFDGAMVGATATMDHIAATKASELRNVSGEINGVFTGSGIPAFVGGFGLQSGSDFVQGMTLIQGSSAAGL
jgi:hypothetical protein